MAIENTGLDELNAGSIVEITMKNGDKPKTVVNLGPTEPKKEGCDPQPPAGPPLWRVEES